jgi:hypothetical protein
MHASNVLHFPWGTRPTGKPWDGAGHSGTATPPIQQPDRSAPVGFHVFPPIASINSPCRRGKMKVRVQIRDN